MVKILVILLAIVTLTGCSSSMTALSSGVNEKDDITDVTKRIEGREAGVLFDSSSGAPGASPSILIRGISSINAGIEPLYILDGMPFNGPLSLINPYDIESIKILKNPSETSIYGIRGGNGVVVITTKKGGAKLR